MITSDTATVINEPGLGYNDQRVRVYAVATRDYEDLDEQRIMTEEVVLDVVLKAGTPIKPRLKLIVHYELGPNWVLDSFHCPEGEEPF